MEPLDTDMRYTINEPGPATPGSRLNILLIFPAIGLILVLVFIGAAVFQWDLSGLINALVGLMLLLFVALVGVLFWALAPGATNQ